jgi:hypothetical protein
VLFGVDMTAKTLSIQVEDNGVGIDPHVTPGGCNTAARPAPPDGTPTSCGAPSREPPLPG